MNNQYDVNEIKMTGTVDGQVFSGKKKVAYAFFKILSINKPEKEGFHPGKVYISIKLFGQDAETIGANLKEGDRIWVEGALGVETYESKKNPGSKMYSPIIKAKRIGTLNVTIQPQPTQEALEKDVPW